MSPTPYAPPTARVGDPPELVLAKPVSVRSAAACLWISAALAVVLTAVELIGMVAGDRAIRVVLTGSLTIGLLVLVAAKIGAGRGWVRWLFVAVYAFGSLIFVFLALLAPRAFLSLPLLVQTSGVVQFALQTAALVLIFSRTSRQWFKARYVASSQSAL